MTSTPITIRPETPAASQLQELNKNILDHAESIYKGEQENAGKSDINTMLGTGRYDSKGRLVHKNAAWDGLGWLGGRSKVIQGIINDTSRRNALLEGPDGQGRYQSLTWIDRNIHKITDEDVTKALHNWQISERNKDPELRKGLRELTPEQRSQVTSLTPLGDVEEMITKRREYKDLEERVRGMDLSPEGQVLRDQLLQGQDGKPLSTKDLKALETKLIPLTRKDIRASQVHDSKMQTAESTRNVSEGTLELSRLQERNSNKLQNAKIDLENEKIDYEWRKAQADRDYEWRSAEADRELKKTLTMLGLDDKAAEREMRYQEREEQNRQLMILQLLKGLQNIGGAFAN